MFSFSGRFFFFFFSGFTIRLRKLYEEYRKKKKKLNNNYFPDARIIEGIRLQEDRCNISVKEKKSSAPHTKTKQFFILN